MPAELRMLRRLPLTLLLFASPAVAQDLPGILLETRIAEQTGAGVGDTVTVDALAGQSGPSRFVVSGIFEREVDPSRISRNELEVRLHLPDLERMLPLTDRVDRFAIALEPGASTARVGEWLEGLAYGTRAFGTAELADRSSTTFRVISRFHRAIGVVTMLAAGIFLLCVMIIRVDERRPDVRVLRLIGVRRRSIFLSVVVEALLIAAVGTGLGILLGLGLSQLVNGYYARVYETSLLFAMPTEGIVASAGLLGLGLGVGAGALAALRLVRLPPERLGER